MCSLIILRRPGHRWPILIGANRDEKLSRSARPPGRHWPDRPEVKGGLDETAGGSWLALNDWGLLACILNRPHSLGPEAGRRSRGELVLDALDHADATSAADALRHLDGGAYRPFNLLLADAQDAFWLKHDGSGRIEVNPVPPGLGMLTSHDLNDALSPRVTRYRPLFANAAQPVPEEGDWQDWELLLGARAGRDKDALDAMCIVTDDDYGTVSSTLLALPATPPDLPVWLHAEGRPGEAPFRPVEDGAAA